MEINTKVKPKRKEKITVKSTFKAIAIECWQTS